MVDWNPPIERWALGVERWTVFPPAIVPFVRRIRARYGDSGAIDVPANPVFAARARFGSTGTFANGHDNQPCAEYRSARIQERHAANLGKESWHQKPVVAEATEQLGGANYLAEE